MAEATAILTAAKILIRDVIEPTDGYSLVSTIDMNLTKILSDTASEWFYETDENGERVRTAKKLQYSCNGSEYRCYKSNGYGH